MSFHTELAYDTFYSIGDQEVHYAVVSYIKSCVSHTRIKIRPCLITRKSMKLSKFWKPTQQLIIDYYNQV